MEAELQAAAISKEEALIDIKAKTLKLEEELVQVKPSWGLRCTALVPTWE